MVARCQTNRSFDGWRTRLRQLRGATTQTQSQCPRDDRATISWLLSQTPLRWQWWAVLLIRPAAWKCVWYCIFRLLFCLSISTQPEKHRATQKSKQKPCYNARFFKQLRISGCLKCFYFISKKFSRTWKIFATSPLSPTLTMAKPH